MEDDHNDIGSSMSTSSANDFQPARFHSDLHLPPADEQLAKDAATAIRQEYRDCSKWKRLRCRKVSVYAERDRGTCAAVLVGQRGRQRGVTENLTNDFELHRNDERGGRS